MRRPLERPMRISQVPRLKLGPGPHEALFIQGYAAMEPSGIGRCSGHEENMADPALLQARLRAAPLDALEMLATFQRGELRPGVQGDHRTFLDAPDQIARHAVRQSARADEHVHMAAAIGEKYGGLARRIAA